MLEGRDGLSYTQFGVVEAGDLIAELTREITHPRGAGAAELEETAALRSKGIEDLCEYSVELLVAVCPEGRIPRVDVGRRIRDGPDPIPVFFARTILVHVPALPVVLGRNAKHMPHVP